jgi:glycerol uptake facilitator-like aquaporin
MDMSTESSESSPARPYLVEAVGTFLLVLVSGGAVCIGQALHDGQSPATALLAALATGLVLAGALAWTVPISGGYLNPAITLTLWVYKKLEGGRTTGLILSQLVGAVAAGAALRMLFASDGLLPARLGTPHLNYQAIGYSTLTLWGMIHGSAAELCFTFVLTITIFATLIDERAPALPDGAQRGLTCLWVGLVAATLTLVGFKVTGAAANPARWFGSAIWELSVDGLRGRTPTPLADHMVYWIGPIVGALLGGGVYLKLVLGEGDEEPAASVPAVPATAGAGGSTSIKAKK